MSQRELLCCCLDVFPLPTPLAQQRQFGLTTLKEKNTRSDPSLCHVTQNGSCSPQLQSETCMFWFKQLTGRKKQICSVRVADGVNPDRILIFPPSACVCFNAVLGDILLLIK